MLESSLSELESPPDESPYDQDTEEISNEIIPDSSISSSDEEIELEVDKPLDIDSHVESSQLNKELDLETERNGN